MSKIVVAPWAASAASSATRTAIFLRFSARFRKEAASGSPASFAASYFAMNSSDLAVSRSSPGKLVRPEIAPPAPADLDEGEHLEHQKHPEEAPQAAGSPPEGAAQRGPAIPGPGEPGGRLDLLEFPDVVLLPGADEIADRAGEPARRHGIFVLLHQLSPPLIPLRSVALSITPTSSPPSVITMGWSVVVEISMRPLRSISCGALGARFNSSPGRGR